MKYFPKALFALLTAGLVSAHAAVPPPEQLVPGDALVVATIPDAGKLRTAFDATALIQFWNCPEMKPFHDKFMARFNAAVVGPVEKDLGTKLSDYLDIARGQVTFAFLPPVEAGKDPEGVILIDSGDKSADAAKLLTALKKSWTDSGRPLKTQTVRDVEFTEVSLDGKSIASALEKSFPKAPGSATPGKAKNSKTEFCIGQSGSLLMIGEKPAVFEKILARLSGGGVSPLAEQAAFTGIHSSNLRDSVGYVYVNAKKVMGEIMKELDKADSPLGGGPAPAKFISALGLSGVDSLAAYVKHEPDGTVAGFFVGAPESNRKGLVKLFSPEAKDASPPPFVPADATRFFRWRIDGQKTLAGIEALAVELFPPAQGLIGMIMDSAGKDQDPNFDLRKSFIGNLGDDMLSYEKPPRSAKPADLDSPPSVTLVGSPRAEQLVSAARIGLGSLLPPIGDGGPKEREFLGRKIYTLPKPSLPGEISTEPKALSYTASGSYMVLSTDAPALEEYLRGPEAQGRPLREIPGLNEAAQKVGGMNTGMFGYENQLETTRLLYEAVRKDPEAFDRMMQGPLGMSPISSEMRQNRAEWLDFSLLPPWSVAAKYFSFSVYAGSTAADGLHFKLYSPNPPGLKK